MKKIPAAVALIFNRVGKILSVSRKHNHNDKGLPGGKLDEGETFEEAIIREVFEETGLHIKVIELIYDTEDRQDSNREVKTFLCEITDEEIPTEFSNLDEKETGKVEWVSWEELISGSSFGEYNRSLYFKLLSRKHVNPDCVKQFHLED